MAIQSGGFGPGGGNVIARAGKLLANMKAPSRPAGPANNPLLNPGQPLSGAALRQAAQTLTNAQVQGPLAELAQQIAAGNRQTNATEKLAGGYFNTLGGQAQQGVTDEKGIADALNAKLAQIGQGTNTQLGQIGDNATSSLLSHSPTGDGGLSTPALANLTAEIAKAEGLAAQQEGAQQAFGATQGANYGGLASTNLGVNALRGTEALKSIAQSGIVRNEPLTQKIADLQASKGARDDERGEAQAAGDQQRDTSRGWGSSRTRSQRRDARTRATILGENARNTTSTNAATLTQNALNAANTERKTRSTRLRSKAD